MTARASERSGVKLSRAGERDRARGHRCGIRGARNGPIGGTDDGVSARAKRNCQRNCCAVSRPVVTHSHGSRGPLVSRSPSSPPTTTRGEEDRIPRPPSALVPRRRPRLLPLSLEDREVRPPLISGSPCAAAPSPDVDSATSGTRSQCAAGRRAVTNGRSKR
ncbi:hypothetical protein PUN28_004550 [Cardiocondyla obscurior]|uniref:Histone H3 n=1 Tax=Cardiocondyla obscurior TaxID=286306 RepID=A0AAW2GBD5_9HYME